MKRRRNFFWGDKWEVRAYVYGKDRAREGRNVETWSFSDRSAAERRFEREERKGYPTLELVNLETGEVVSWVASGERYNTGRRTRKARKARTSVTKRDVFAQVAKARKTTKGHRRKERARAVAKGHDRRAKHRRRYNPDADEQRWTKFRDKLSAAYPDAYVAGRTTYHGQLRRFIADLKRAGVPSEDLPDPANVAFGQMAERAAAVVVAAGHAQYRTDSAAEFGVAPKTLAMRLFQVGPGGVFEAFYAEHPGVFDPAVAALAKKVATARGRVTRADTKARKAIAGVAKSEATKAQQKADRDEKKLRLRMGALQAELGEDIPDDVAAELAEQYSDTERELEAEELREEEPLTPAALTLTMEPSYEDEDEYDEDEYYEARVSPTQRAARRLGQYKRHRADVRRTDVRPPLQVVADAREDILLYALKDGTTQVWAKGALTETFLPDKNTSSVTIAHRYANRWRGLGPKGRLREGTDEHPPPKKSRLRSRVLLAVEGKKGVKEIEKSIAQSIGRVTPKAARVHDLPDLDTYELKGDRANPRRRRNTRGTEISFYSSLSENQLYALRLGKWYRLSMPRSREVFGREAVEHILSEAPGEISTSISRDEWKYLLPKEVPHSRHGPDETAHYRNPRRRKNTKLTYAQWEAQLKRELKSVRYPHSWAHFKAELRSRTQSGEEALREGWRSGEHPARFLQAHADEMGSSLRYNPRTAGRVGKYVVYVSDGGTSRGRVVGTIVFGPDPDGYPETPQSIARNVYGHLRKTPRSRVHVKYEDEASERDLELAREREWKNRNLNNPRRRKNALVEFGDAALQQRLYLYAVKSEQLYRSRIEPILKNIAKKKAKGVYDYKKSLVMWKYAADDAAKLYNGGYQTPGYGPFTPDIRRAVAKRLAERYARRR